MLFQEWLANMHFPERKCQEEMMLLLRVESLEKLFTPDIGLETIPQISTKIIIVFIKNKETDVYPVEGNVFAIISLNITSKGKRNTKDFLERSKTFSHQ